VAYGLKVYSSHRQSPGRSEFGTNTTTFSPPWHKVTTIVYTNNWYHLAIIIDNQSVRIFIDSTIDSESSYTGQLGVSTHLIFIGISADMVRGVKGLIDDTRIYERALSAPEVKTLYNLGQ
jgi:hypothetical protein